MCLWMKAQAQNMQTCKKTKTKTKKTHAHWGAEGSAVICVELSSDK